MRDLDAAEATSRARNAAADQFYITECKTTVFPLRDRAMEEQRRRRVQFMSQSVPAGFIQIP